MIRMHGFSYFAGKREIELSHKMMLSSETRMTEWIVQLTKGTHSR